jgi:hypothetical protein
MTTAKGYVLSLSIGVAPRQHLNKKEKAVFAAVGDRLGGLGADQG